MVEVRDVLERPREGQPDDWDVAAARNLR